MCHLCIFENSTVGKNILKGKEKKRKKPYSEKEDTIKIDLISFNLHFGTIIK